MREIPTITLLIDDFRLDKQGSIIRRIMIVFIFFKREENEHTTVLAQS